MARDTWPAMLMMVWATALRRVPPFVPFLRGPCRKPVTGVAAVALVVVCRAAGRVLAAPFRAVVVPPTFRQHTRVEAGRATEPRQRRQRVCGDLSQKTKNTGRVCRDPLPALPLSLCVGLFSRGPEAAAAVPQASLQRSPTALATARSRRTTSCPTWLSGCRAGDHRFGPVHTGLGRAACFGRPSHPRA